MTSKKPSGKPRKGRASSSPRTGVASTEKDGTNGLVWEPPPPSSLRGLLPDPPEVVRVVERWQKERPASEEARRRITDELKLQFYFGGHWIAYRHTSQGTEVLAVGDKEIRQMRRRAAPELWDALVLGYIEPW